MAMIQCPECGQEISDKAKKCIHCGRIFVEEKVIKEEIICGECGAILSEMDEICPNCGCPVETKSSETVKPQQVELTNIKMTTNTKKNCCKNCCCCHIVFSWFSWIQNLFQQQSSKRV